MYNKQDIFWQLRLMNAPQNKPVLMHSAFSLIGDVEGGAQGLLDALIDYFTAYGGLFCVPTHTWRNCGKDVPTLDLTKNEQCLGYFSTVALEDGRGIRSENPTHSMVVFGDREKALRFVENEPYITSPTPLEGCYGKLYTEGGYVLLAGVGQERNTYLHAVGEMLELPNRMLDEVTQTTVKKENGDVVHRELKCYDQKTLGDVSQRFTKYEVPFKYRKAVTCGFLGDAPATFCDARKMYETVALIFERGADPMINGRPIHPSLYK